MSCEKVYDNSAQQHVTGTAKMEPARTFSEEEMPLLRLHQRKDGQRPDSCIPVNLTCPDE